MQPDDLSVPAQGVIDWYARQLSETQHRLAIAETGWAQARADLTAAQKAAEKHHEGDA